MHAKHADSEGRMICRDHPCIWRRDRAGARVVQSVRRQQFVGPRGCSPVSYTNYLYPSGSPMQVTLVYASFTPPSVVVARSPVPRDVACENAGTNARQRTAVRVGGADVGTGAGRGHKARIAKFRQRPCGPDSGGGLATRISGWEPTTGMKLGSRTADNTPCNGQR